MKKRNNRIQRVNELIQNSLAEILQREAETLRCGIITVTGVEVSQDMSHAKIFVSVLDEAKAKETIAILNEASKPLRYELAHSVKLRITPDIKFVYDDSAVRGSRISSLIENALRHDKSHGE